MKSTRCTGMMALGLMWVCLQTGCVTPPLVQSGCDPALEKSSYAVEPIASPSVIIKYVGKDAEIIDLTSGTEVSLSYQKASTNAPSSVLLGATYSVKGRQFNDDDPRPLVLSQTAGQVSITEKLRLTGYMLHTFENATGTGDIIIALFEAIPSADPKRNSDYGRQVSNPIRLRVKI